MSDPELSGEDVDRVVAALGTAIGEVISREEHGMVTRWVVVVESIDPEGRRGIWMGADPGAKAWDSIGLMQYALMHEQGAEVVQQWSERFADGDDS